VSQLLAIFLFCLAYISVAQTKDFRKEASLLKNVIVKQHYHPKEINDQFSEEFYDQLF
jgi:hypothetical protein